MKRAIVQRYTFRQVLRQVRGAQSSLGRAETRYYRRGDALLEALFVRMRKALHGLERDARAAVQRVKASEPAKTRRAA